MQTPSANGVEQRCPLVYDPTSSDVMSSCEYCVKWWNQTLGARCDTMNEWESHVRRKHLKKNTSHEGNGKHCGAWAFTLNASPSDGLTEFDMIRAARKIMSQRSNPVKKYAWYLEYGKNGNPHIHGMYETNSGGRIEAKHFMRAWPIWDEKTRLGAGHRGGYHKEVISEAHYSYYIKKDAGKSESMGIEEPVIEIQMDD